MGAEISEKMTCGGWIILGIVIVMVIASFIVYNVNTKKTVFGEDNNKTDYEDDNNLINKNRGKVNAYL